MNCNRLLFARTRSTESAEEALTGLINDLSFSIIFQILSATAVTYLYPGVPYCFTFYFQGCLLPRFSFGDLIQGEVQRSFSVVIRQIFRSNFFLLFIFSNYSIVQGNYNQIKVIMYFGGNYRLIKCATLLLKLLK